MPKGATTATSKAAESSAIVYTLVETAKANGSNPHTYLLRLLEELPYLGRDPSQKTWIFSCHGNQRSRPPVPLRFLLDPPGTSDEVPGPF